MASPPLFGGAEMKTRCAFCDKEMDWNDRGAITVPTHGIYEEESGKKSNGRVAIVFCSDECSSKFAETMLGKGVEFQTTIVEMEKEIKFLKSENANLASNNKLMQKKLREKNELF